MVRSAGVRLIVLAGILCGLWIHREALAHPEVPGEESKRPIAILGATVHTISDGVLEEATVLIRDGKIAAVGRDVKIPKRAIRIDAAGKHVAPGLFAANSDLGLVEINSVRATLDQNETGSITPNVKAWVSVNPDSEIIPVTRSNGVLLALTAPTGGLLAGQSAVLQLDGWTYEDLTLKPAVAMHVGWPAMAPVIDWETERSAKEQLADRDEALERMRGPTPRRGGPTPPPLLMRGGKRCSRCFPASSHWSSTRMISSRFRRRWHLRWSSRCGSSSTVATTHRCVPSC